MKNKWLLIWQSCLAVLQVVVGASALGDVIGPKWYGLLAVAVGGLQVGTATFVHGWVTPVPPQGKP